jgi:nickel-dependent lactate racemase
VLPGVSGEISIRENHAPEMLLDPRARPGCLDGNPVWEDMLEAARLGGLDFIVNAVLTPDGLIADVVAGDVREAHREAVRRYEALYGVYVPEAPADIVVTTPGPPLSLNLYQSVKAIVAAECTVRDGGVIVLYARCQEGLGGDLFAAPYRGSTSPQEVIARAKQAYRIEMDHALLLSRLQAERGLRFVAVTPGVPAETLREMLFLPAQSLPEAYRQAKALVETDVEDGQSIRMLIFCQPQKLVGVRPSLPRLPQEVTVGQKRHR